MPLLTERFAAPKVGLARLEELRTAWTVAVEALARHRWEAWRARIADANPLWPAWEDATKDDDSGEGAEYVAVFLSDAEHDLLDASRAGALA